MSEKGTFVKVNAVHAAFRAIAGHYNSTPSLIFPSLVPSFSFSEQTSVLNPAGGRLIPLLLFQREEVVSC